LASAVVKLRDLLHPDLGLPTSDREDLDLFSLQQVPAFLEAERRRVEHMTTTITSAVAGSTIGHSAR
jgi:hypothetical protein